MMDNNEVIPNIAAENAVLKVKIKQEYDNACAIVNDINLIDLKIGACDRENKQYNQLLKCIQSELGKYEEELENIYSSRERSQSNIENLKKQHEFNLIEEEQKRKERDSVRLTYESMIRNTKEIYNSNFLVKKKNELQSKHDISIIQLAVLNKRVEEASRKKWQLQQIQELKLRNNVIELAQVFVELKRLNEKNQLSAHQIWKKKESLVELKKQREKEEAEVMTENVPEKPIEIPAKTVNSPKSPFTFNWTVGTKPPINFLNMKAVEQTDLFKCFQQLSSFKTSRTPFVLPPLLSRSYSPKPLHSSAKSRAPKSPSGEQKASPEMKSAIQKLPEKVKINAVTSDANSIYEKEKPNTPVPGSTTDEKVTKKELSKELSNDVNLPAKLDSSTLPVDNNQGEMTDQICSINLNNHDTGLPKHISLLPVSVKSTPERFQKDKIISPQSRIPIRVGKSPYKNASGIPIRCSPSPKVVSSAQSAQKREFINYAESIKNFPVTESPSKLSKENVSRFNKRIEANSPKRSKKQSKMDYEHPPRMEAQKVKRKPGYEKGPHYGVGDSNLYRQNIRKNVHHVEEMNVKLSQAVRRKKAFNDEIVSKFDMNLKKPENPPTEETYTNTEKMEKFLDFILRQFPNDVKNFRSAFQDYPELMRKISQFERSGEHQVDKLKRNVKSVTLEKHVSEINQLKHQEIDSFDFLKEKEILKRRPPSEFLKTTDRSAQERSEIGLDEGENTKFSDNETDTAAKINIGDNKKPMLNECEKGTNLEKIEEENHSKYFTNEKELREKNDSSSVYNEEPYLENYQSDNENTYVGSDGAGYELGSIDLNYNRNYSSRFSPVSDVFSTTTPDIQPFTMPLFGSMNSNGGTFGFGSSVNQIFGSNDESAPNNGNQSGGFSFNFTEQSGNQQPFRFY